MYCKTCGEEINDKAVICPKCGCATNNEVTAIEDASSVGYALLGFFIPVVGLILYLLWKNTTPLRAKSAGKGALVAVIVEAVILVLYIVIVLVALGTVSSYPSYY